MRRNSLYADNASVHAIRSTVLCRNSKNIRVLDWLACSPDQRKAIRHNVDELRRADRDDVEQLKVCQTQFLILFPIMADLSIINLYLYLLLLITDCNRIEVSLWWPYAFETVENLWYLLKKFCIQDSSSGIVSDHCEFSGGSPPLRNVAKKGKIYKISGGLKLLKRTA